MIEAVFSLLESYGDYAVVFLVVFFFNILPAFAPPTWATLSYFKLKNPALDTLSLAFIGVIGSTLGRWVLYLYSYYLGRRFIDPKRAENLLYLRKLIEEHGPFIGSFLYAIGPLPSNFLFIIAGVSGAKVLPILAGFFLGRLLSYTFFISLSFKLFGPFAKAFEENRWVLDILALVAAVALLFVDWKSIYFKVVGFKVAVKEKVREKKERLKAKVEEEKERLKERLKP